MTRGEQIAEAKRRIAAGEKASLTLPLAVDPPCRYRGPPTGALQQCPTCSGTVSLKLFYCNVHGTCTLTKPVDGSACCASCVQRKAPEPTGSPSLVRRFDEKSLWPGTPGRRFNCSMVPWAGGHVFVTRNGWRGSDIYAGFLDQKYNPIGAPTKLELTHRESSYGREDPRLFVHDGQLHLAFVGVVGGVRIRHTNILYARLGDHFRVEEIINPHIEGRQLWEKNHGSFSHGGQIHAVYSISPHRVYRLVAGKAEWVSDEPFPVQWPGGEWRGGAPPVLVGDEYWNFAHDRILVGGMQNYRTLLYTFEAKPPFRPLRYLPRPVLTADVRTKPADQYCAVAFVGGAFRSGPDWILAHGVHDRYSEIHKFDHAELDAALVPVSQEKTGVRSDPT